MENFKKYIEEFDIESPFSVEPEGWDEDMEYRVELDMFKFKTKEEAEMVAEIFNEMFTSMVYVKAP